MNEENEKLASAIWQVMQHRFRPCKLQRQVNMNRQLIYFEFTNDVTIIAITIKKMEAAHHTVHDAIVACGLTDGTLYNGHTKAQRIATELFDDDINDIYLQSSVEDEYIDC